MSQSASNIRCSNMFHHIWDDCPQMTHICSALGHPRGPQNAPDLCGGTQASLAACRTTCAGSQGQGVLKPNRNQGGVVVSKFQRHGFLCIFECVCVCMYIIIDEKTPSTYIICIYIYIDIPIYIYIAIPIIHIYSCYIYISHICKNSCSKTPISPCV